MAINDIYNSLTFGGINSLDYGVYISGPGVFDAPTRDVELVDVPGRNGAIEIDRGHWNNIEVRYTAGTFGDNQSDFAKNVNAFRNAIVSQLGYQRLTDTYNPEEYRLGIYSSGLEVSAVNYNQAGEFELVFNCKPQRFLLSGEDSVSVSDGDTLANPTLYPSSPLVQIFGNGSVRFNGYNINVSEGYLGNVVICENATFDENNGHAYQYRVDANEGDTMTFEGLTFYGTRTTLDGRKIHLASIEKISGADGIFSYRLSADQRTLNWSFAISPESIQTCHYQSLDDYFIIPDSEYTLHTKVDSRSYEERILFQAYAISSDELFIPGNEECWATLNKATINSTAVALGNPTIINTEIGEVYKIEDGQLIDLNKYVTLGSDLPKLAPGDNTITFDDTISLLFIRPRWWEL